VSRVDSVPMTLFMLWHEKQYGTYVVRPAKPAQDPVQSLEQAVDELTASFGTWRVPWGDLNRLERRHSGVNARPQGIELGFGRSRDVVRDGVEHGLCLAAGVGVKLHAGLLIVSELLIV